MKKILLFLLASVFVLTLAACTKEEKKVDKTNLRATVEVVETQIRGLAVNTENKPASEIEEGVELISVEGKQAADDVLNAANEVIKNEKATQEQVDKATSDLIDFTTNFTNFIVRGTKQNIVEFNQDGLKEVIGELKKLVQPLRVAESADKVALGKKFITPETKTRVDNVLNEVKELSEKADGTQEQYQTAIEKVNEMRTTVVNSIRLGSKPIAPTVFNLNGDTVKFYSHNAREDDPENAAFQAPSGLDKQTYTREYKKFLAELQKEYNFKLEFVQYTEPENQAQEISQKILGDSKHAMIVRTSQTKEFIDHFTKRNLIEIGEIIDALEAKEPGKYLIGPWQKEKGKILGKYFGIQRNDSVTYPDLLLFNRELLRKYGIQDIGMPDKLWGRNEWTFEKFAEMINTVNGKLEEGITSLGITPYYIGINALRANGVELINDNAGENSFNLTDSNNLSIVAKWVDLVKNNDKNGSWYLKSKYPNLLTAYESVNKNHFADDFGNGNFVFATVQEWQASGIATKDVVKDYSVVPFPQVGKQDNSKYVSTIEAGDVLSVTRGENANQVAVILMRINKWIKEQDDKRMENLRKDYELPEESTAGKILSYDFVENKTKNKTEEDKELAIKIAAFIHGYKLDDENDFTKVAISSKLPIVGIDIQYTDAIQRALFDSKPVFDSINKELVAMKQKYQQILEIIKQYD